MCRELVVLEDWSFNTSRDILNFTVNHLSQTNNNHQIPHSIGRWRDRKDICMCEHRYPAYTEIDALLCMCIHGFIFINSTPTTRQQATRGWFLFALHNCHKRQVHGHFLPRKKVNLIPYYRSHKAFPFPSLPSLFSHAEDGPL